MLEKYTGCRKDTFDDISPYCGPRAAHDGEESANPALDAAMPGT